MLKSRRILLLSVIALPLIIGLSWWWNRQALDPQSSFQRGLAAITARDVIALNREVEILRRQPDSQHEVELLRGAILLNARDYPAAFAEFAACSHHPQTHVWALTLAGETLCRLEKQTEAIKVLERAVELQSPPIEAYRWLAIACYDVGAKTRAATALRKVIQFDEKDFRPHRLLGLIQRERGLLEDAVYEYRACLNLKPGNEALREAVLFELSDCLARLNRFDDSLKFVDQAAESADIQAVRANCFYGLGNYSSARTAAERAIQLNPEHIEGRGWLANIELIDGHYEAAVKHLERIIQRYPKEAAPHMKLALALERLNKKTEAQKQRQLADEITQLEQRLQKLTEKAIDDPKDVATRLELGDLSVQLQRDQVARIWYRAALSLDPKSVKAKAALQKLPQPRQEASPSPATEL